MISQLFSKKKKDASMQWLFAVLAKLGFTPNGITILSLVFALAAASYIIVQDWLFALLFIILAFGSDALDGGLARYLKQSSFAGNYFDAMMDKVVEIILLLGFAFHFPFPAILALAGTFLVSYAKPRVALVIETDNRDWPAIGERVDRAILVVVGVGFAMFYPVYLEFLVLEVMLYTLAFVTGIGFLQRFMYAQTLIKEAVKKGKILPYLTKAKPRKKRRGKKK